MSARKPNKPITKKRSDFQFKGFVEYNLTNEETKFLKERGTDYERLLDTMCHLVDQGFTFKFGHDDYNDCYQVSCTPKETDHKSAGWFLVGRGSEPIKALRQTLYIGEQIGWNFADWMDDKPTNKIQIDD